MRLRSEVHPVLTEQAGALLDERSGRWTHLSGTAAVALHLLLTNEEHQRAVARYAAWFGIEHRLAEQDLAAVEESLAGRGLLARPRRRTAWRWWR